MYLLKKGGDIYEIIIHIIKSNWKLCYVYH